ncbi:bacterial transferase hexapeptide family protein, partial [Vibrio cholerae HC-77A1]
RFQSH